MSQPTTSNEKTPFHLRGNFAPVFEERTERDLPVTGAIPPELCGRFFRNGANPKSGWSPHWFLGNGMIHGVELREGRNDLLVKTCRKGEEFGFFSRAYLADGSPVRQTAPPVGESP